LIAGCASAPADELALLAATAAAAAAAAAVLAAAAAALLGGFCFRPATGLLLLSSGWVLPALPAASSADTIPMMALFVRLRGHCN
jgi:ABC-type multidrug transport system permease subunit